MSTILGSFKIKPFDLEPIYASWTDAPKFLGKPKKDPPVDEWLKQIKAGCIERKIPQEYWPKVAQHYMGDKAKARLNELKAVMEKVHGGKYKCTWKKYKIAMRNMGCEWDFLLSTYVSVRSPYTENIDTGTIETTATQAIEVQGKSSSWQWLTWKKPETEEPQPMQRPSHVKSSTTDSSFWKNSKLSKGDNEFEIVPPQRPVPTKSTTTDSSFWSALTSSKPDSKDNPPTPAAAANATRPVPTKSKTDSFWITRKPSVNDSPQPQVQAQRPDFVTSISNSVLGSMTTRGTPNPVQPARADSTDGECLGSYITPHR